MRTQSRSDPHARTFGGSSARTGWKDMEEDRCINCNLTWTKRTWMNEWVYMNREKGIWRETDPLDWETLWEAGRRNVYTGLQREVQWCRGKMNNWKMLLKLLWTADINHNMLMPCPVWHFTQKILKLHCDVVGEALIFFLCVKITPWHILKCAFRNLKRESMRIATVSVGNIGSEYSTL